MLKGDVAVLIDEAFHGNRRCGHGTDLNYKRYSGPYARTVPPCRDNIGIDVFLLAENAFERLATARQDAKQRNNCYLSAH